MTDMSGIAQNYMQSDFNKCHEVSPCSSPNFNITHVTEYGQKMSQSAPQMLLFK